jgi:CheY-like chemotaxis protein
MSAPVLNGETVQSSGLRILLADDFADCATSLAALLRVWGHAVTIAQTGTETIASALRDRPDVVLLDIGLPEMNGYDVAKELRRELGSEMPWLIAVTGLGRRIDRQRSAEAGIELHLLKPVDLHQLRNILEKFLKSRSEAALVVPNDG